MMLKVKEPSMRKLFLSIVAAASVLGATAAMAQSVEFNVGPRHSGIYARDHDFDRDRGWRRSHNEWRGDRDVVVIRKHPRHWDHGRFYRDRD
jgi:Ni/Co efflux regulator RcnB